MSAESPPSEKTVIGGSLPQGTDMLSTFLSLMPDAAVAVGTKGLIVAVNERVEISFGYKAADLEGKPIELLVPERFRHDHRRDRADYAAEPHARPMGAGLELYARRKDGSEFPVDISLAPIGDADNPLVVAAVRDISERKAAQAAEAQLAAIVESSGEGIFSITDRGIITSWNPGAQTIFGYRRDQVVSQHIGDFFPDDPVLEELMGTAGHVTPARSRDTRWQTSSGEVLDVAITVSALAVGNARGFSVLVRDITARKAAEAQLARAAQYQAATAEIRLNLLSEASLESSLDLVCSWALRLWGARSALLFVADIETPVSVAGFAGPEEDRSTFCQLGQVPPLVAGAIEGQATKQGSLSFMPGTEALVHPINFTFPSERKAALIVIAAEGHAWLEDQNEVLQSLAASALLAFELASVRADRDRLLISADRERIARDLHDLVIQRLFGAGLRLQGALNLIDNPLAVSRVNSTVNDLDGTIKEIREAIFALESAPGAGLQAKVSEASARAAEGLGFMPSVSFLGDTWRDVPLQAQIEAAAVLREALSNAARHAKATAVTVVVTVDDNLTVSVTDNGAGIGQPERLSGISNARARAELLGGRLVVEAGPEGGTHFDWRVPLPAR